MKPPDIPTTAMLSAVHKTQEYFLWALSKEVFEEHGVTAYAPCLKEPNLNIAVQTQDIEGNLEDRFQTIDAFYKTQDLLWFWMLTPTRDQENLKEVLYKNQFTVIEKSPVFIGFFDTLHPQKIANGLTIKEVGEDKLTEWARPLQRAFQSTDQNTRLYREAHARALRKGACLRHFVGYYDETPVGAGTLSLSPSGARLDDLGIDPAYKRQGFGKAMTEHQMSVARDLGYPWVCLEASPQGSLLYKSLGLHVLYHNELYAKAGASA